MVRRAAALYTTLYAKLESGNETFNDKSVSCLLTDKQYSINSVVTNNYLKLKPKLFVLPVLLLAGIIAFLYSKNALNTSGYAAVQKNWFLYLNSKLSVFPNTLYNLTQFGDVLIFLSFLTLFIIYAPKIWGCILSAFLVSIVFSCIPKKIFLMPRPAAVFDNNTFTIIGRILKGNSSLPSGHSVTVFMILTILSFAFAPKKLLNKILYFFFVITIGLLLVSTRVGVGAHYPLDVVIGAIMGYLSGISGIFISRKIKTGNWVYSRKFYLVLILLFIICASCIVKKIVTENLIIYYLALAATVLSIYKTASIYVKK